MNGMFVFAYIIVPLVVLGMGYAAMRSIEKEADRH